MIKVNKFTADENRLFLRTSENGVSYGEFKRKPIGQWNDADNWTGIANINQCGGFFGIDSDAKNYGLPIRPTLELCEWRGERVVIDGAKICVSSYRVLVTNEDIPDTPSVNKLLDACSVYVRGEHEINSGWCYAQGDATVNQSGGECWASYESIVNQSGGFCVAYVDATVNQTGGLCVAHEEAIVNQSGGDCMADDGATVNKI